MLFKTYDEKYLLFLLKKNKQKTKLYVSQTLEQKMP